MRLLRVKVLPEATAKGFRLADPFPAWPRRGRPGSVAGAARLVRVNPDLDGTDGFFVALFERAGADAAARPASGEEEVPLLGAGASAGSGAGAKRSGSPGGGKGAKRQRPGRAAAAELDASEEMVPCELVSRRGGTGAKGQGARKVAYVSPEAGEETAQPTRGSGGLGGKQQAGKKREAAKLRGRTGGSKLKLQRS